jgi:peptidoglycan/LPS O-acetylase OafA/YrhL
MIMPILGSLAIWVGPHAKAAVNEMTDVPTRSGTVIRAGQSTASSTVSSSYVPEIDALRGLAMTAVVAIHCGLFPMGWMGVWLFFVISGFAVATSLFSTKHRTAEVWSRIETFYARRALRIWPIYFLFVAANALVIVSLGESGSLQEVPWLMTFTQNIKMIIESYAPGTCWPGFAHLWTLSTEQQFYVVFPLLLLLTSRRSRAIALLCVIAIAPLIRYATARWAMAYGFDDLHIAFAVYAFGPGHFDAFAIGTLIALYREEISQDRRLARLATIVALMTMSVYGLAYVIINSVLIDHFSVGVIRNIVSGVLYGQGREVWVYLVPVYASAAVLMRILAGDRHCLRICRLPGLQAIGRISYGGYLFHVPILMILINLVPAFGRPVSGVSSYGVHILLFAAGYLMTIVAAWTSFTFLERHFSQLGRTLADERIGTLADQGQREATLQTIIVSLRPPVE